MTPTKVKQKPLSPSIFPTPHQTLSQSLPKPQSTTYVSQKKAECLRQMFQEILSAVDTSNTRSLEPPRMSKKTHFFGGCGFLVDFFGGDQK